MTDGVIDMELTPQVSDQYRSFDYTGKLLLSIPTLMNVISTPELKCCTPTSTSTSDNSSPSTPPLSPWIPELELDPPMVLVCKVSPPKPHKPRNAVSVAFKKRLHFVLTKKKLNKNM